jgi:hypothetical protein
VAVTGPWMINLGMVVWGELNNWTLFG